MSFKKRSSLPSADDFDKKSNRSWSAKSSSSSKKSKKKEEKDNTPKVSLRQLFRYATPVELLMLFIGTAISLCVGSALPVMSILQGNVSDYFIKAQICWDYENNSNVTGFLCDKEEFKHKVMNVVYGYAGMAVAVFIAANIQITFFLIICEKINNRLRRKFVQSILRQDIPWFDTNNSGALATKLFDNLERVREGTGDKIGLMFQAIGQFFAGFIVAFFHSWELTLVMLAMVPLMAACGFAISRAMTVFTLRESKKYAKAGAVVEQTISSIRTVVALNGLDHEIDRYGDAIAEARHAGILKNLYMGISFGMLGVVQFTSFALAFYVGVGWVADGKMEINDLMTTFFSVLMGSLALGQAGPQLAVVGAAQGAAASIYEVLDREPEIDSTSKNGRTDMKIKGNIELKNVVFNYPSRPDVQILKSLSLNVTAGETVALVGSSGCGKSTVVSLLLRYYNVLGGMISIDGVPIEDINIEFLRNQIAVVSQEPILFNCTIEENIKFGREDITHEEMRHACRLANADNFISALPQAYHTLVGDRGTQLSGGQKQRIAIARALVRDPKILLLDEATSALDAESEGIVQKALETASRGRTTLIIAHRLSTIKNAHKIIALKGGEVVEWGTHDELLEKKGLYFDLVNAQTFTDAIDGQVITEEEGLPRQTSKTARQTSRQMSRELSRLDSSRVSIRSATEAGLRLRAATGMSVAEVGDEPLLEMPGRQKKDDMSRLKQELKDEGVQRTNLFRIIMASRKNWNTMFIGFLFSLVGGLVFPTYSVLFSQIMQSFATIDNDDLKSTGHFWALMFLVLAVVQGTQSFGQVFFMGWGAEGLAMDLRDRLFRNILSMDMGYFDSPLHACGKICTRLASDVPNLRSAMDFRLTTVLTTLVSICAGVGLAFYYGWQMACLVVGILPIVGFGQALRVRVMTGKHRKGAKDFEDSGKVAMEAISNVRTVQALTREEEFYSKFCRHLDGPHREALRESFMQGVSYGFAACVIFILNFASYWLGLHLILEKTMSPMHVLRVMYAVSISASTLGFATSYFPEYMKARLAGGIIFSMLGEQTKIDNLSKAGERPTLTGEVVFKNVKFAYPERPQIEVLKGLNFNVKPGHTLALVGPSGCGKSTVVSLIERFYDPLDGQVLLDGHDLRSLNPLHTRSQIAIVSQEPILFDCSIAENIVYGMEGDVPSKEEIEEAARKANIHIFIESLPDSYGTRVGDKGTQLSGGQKQRIAIARALVRKPKILLLDEATSALDTESEKIVQEALDRAREGRTCIVIAHRLSTVVNADSIAVVKGGLIVEQGNHTELMAHKGVYYELTQKQTVRTTPQ